MSDKGLGAGTDDEPGATLRAVMNVWWEALDGSRTGQSRAKVEELLAIDPIARMLRRFGDHGRGVWLGKQFAAHKNTVFAIDPNAKVRLEAVARSGRKTTWCLTLYEDRGAGSGDVARRQGTMIDGSLGELGECGEGELGELSVIHTGASENRAFVDPASAIREPTWLQHEWHAEAIEKLGVLGAGKLLALSSDDPRAMFYERFDEARPPKLASCGLDSLSPMPCSTLEDVVAQLTHALLNDPSATRFDVVFVDSVDDPGALARDLSGRAGAVVSRGGSVVFRFRSEVPADVARWLPGRLKRLSDGTALHVSQVPHIGVREATCVSLCSGAGGLDLGLMMAGFRHLLAVDSNHQVKETYDSNFDVKLRIADICDKDQLGSIPEHVLLAAGPPCQPFSPSGKRLGWADPRAQAMWAVERVVRSSNPLAVVIENVPGLWSHQNAPETDRFVDALRGAGAGYRVRWQIVNAADHGVAQDRRRVIIVAYRRDLCLEPDLSRLQRSDRVTVWDEIKDLDGKAVPVEYRQQNVSGHEYYAAEPSDYYNGRPRRRAPDEQALAVVSTAAQQQQHPFANRRMTSNELDRIQSVPDWFKYAGSGLRVRQDMTGSMVPPRLAYAIGRLVRGDLEHVGAVERRLFQEARDREASSRLFRKRKMIEAS